MHAHAKIGSGEVIVEIRRGGEAALSSVHREPVVGDVKDSEIWQVLDEAREIADAIRAEWRKMQR